ncbi:MAG: serine hydrolase [Bacteroidetes bacterium]|nr:serine hydrolase [Bacteroidota bacterium]
MRLIRIKVVLLVMVFTSFCKTNYAQTLPPFITPEAELWADSVMKTLTPDERISQLIMVAAWSNKDSVHIKEIRKLIQDWGIGGLCFFQGGPVREALLTNDYQALSKVPLMIGMDAEWGLAMRLDSTVRFPRQMTLAAIKDTGLIYEMGKEIARESKLMGIHVNFAPDADVNNNPLNPVIGSRSFGDNPVDVTEKSLLYMRGMQDQNVLATGKHFPGHGNADTDSHFSLPLILQNRAALDSVELYPFRRLIDAGIGSMMVAHLNVPALDTTPGLPSTLSSSIVTGLLKNEMGFKGLIFTDALNMKGVSSLYKPGEVDKLALLSGNDMLLYTEDVHKAVDEIHLAVQNCEITQEEVDERTKKVLMVKYWTGLNKFQPLDTTDLYNKINSPEALLLQRKIYNQTVTVLANEDSLIPFHTKDTLRIASVVIGDKKDNTFQQQLKMYANVECFAEDKDAPLSMYTALFSYLANYDYIILSLHGTTMKAATNFGIPTIVSRFVDSVLMTYKTVFVDFGNSYTLSRFQNLKKAKAVVLGYEDFYLTHQIVAQSIFGGITSTGKLPVNVLPEFSRYQGLNTTSPIRFEYSLPEAAGMSSKKLTAIDSIVNGAISLGAFPGCQVLVARKGKVIYNKAFGTKTYGSTDTVTTTDLYDIASITKIAGTALATMKLYDMKKLNLNHPLSKYYSKLKSTNKKALLVKEILAHQAGLASWIPFYKQSMKDSTYLDGIYNKFKTDHYSIRVADSLYMNQNYTDSILKWIYTSPVTATGKYVYSDLGPILMKLTTEKITGQPFDQFLYRNFYKPLGLSSLTFKPRDNYNLKTIVPTEDDKVFRKQLIRGDVHDPAAAMMGGVSGNAGLFGTANDLAVIMQLLLNKGSYGGVTYLNPATVDLFTKQQFPHNNNRRGLLFDKPEPDPQKNSPCAKEASLSTFGHQGFTGTCAWADPENELIYIFLSNRVNPDAGNDKMMKLNVRTNIQSAIYQSIIE